MIGGKIVDRWKWQSGMISQRIDSTVEQPFQIWVYLWLESHSEKHLFHESQWKAKWNKQHEAIQFWCHSGGKLYPAQKWSAHTHTHWWTRQAAIPFRKRKMKHTMLYTSWTWAAYEGLQSQQFLAAETALVCRFALRWTDSGCLLKSRQRTQGKLVSDWKVGKTTQDKYTKF